MLNPGLYAKFETTLGNFTVELFEEKVPATVGIVAGLIQGTKEWKHPKTGQMHKDKPYYDGIVFHRVIEGFMIQGGDPLTKDVANEARWGTGDPGYKIKAEFNDRPHVRGVLSAARSQDPNSAGCQFFVCLGDAKFLDRQYTAFGKVIAGDDVLEAIGSVETKNAGGGEKSRPTRRMSVETVQIVPRDSVKA